MTTLTINIPFTKTDGMNTLKDALHLTQAEIDALGEDGIEAMKQKRFDDWVAFITAPVGPLEPSTEDEIDG
jgi:hypothetical protein